MKERLSNDILTALSRSVDPTVVQAFRLELGAILRKYEVTEACTDLSLWHGQYPDCYKYYLATKKIEGISEATLKMYSLYLEDMFDVLSKPIEEITKNDIMGYLFVTQQSRGISNRSLNSRRSALSSFFGWIAAEGYISCNPMLTIKPIKYETKERSALTPLQLEQIRFACQSLRDKAIIEVLYSTACRVSELCTLKRSDVDLQTGIVKLFGKGSKHRDSYLSARAKLMLSNYLNSRDDDCEYLFVSTRAPHKQLDRSAVERVVRIIGETAGINLHPHLFRHTSATDALQNGMDVTQVQRILGHSSLDTTMIYAKVSDADVARNHTKYIH